MVDQKKNDEIDLIDLLLKVVRTFRANFWLIILFFFLGSAFGLAYFFTSKKVFENKMIVSSEILTESYTKTMFENANRYRREGNGRLLAAQFHISEKAAMEIVSLTVEPLTKTEAEDLKESKSLLITVQVFDEQILPELQRGLISYLENNEFAKIRVEHKRTYMKHMLASVEKEIKDLEEFKLRIFRGDFFQSAKGNVMFDPTIVNSKILELKDRKIGYENNLQIVSGIQVIDGFTKFENPSKPKLFSSLLAGSLAGLFIVGLAITFNSIRKLLTMAEATK